MQIDVLPGEVKAEEVFRQVAKTPRTEGLQGAGNCRDNSFRIDNALPVKIAGGTSATAAAAAARDVFELDPDESEGDSLEYSSSVDGDFSDYEDDPGNDSQDLDVFSPDFAGWNRLFRKKKVTEHWRKFIQPLMWRCRWIELRIKELQSQVARYDRELLANYQNELGEIKHMISQPTTMKEQKIYYRKKRRKIEDTVDLASYISQHAVFSYFDNRPEISVDESFTKQAEHNFTDHDDIALSFGWPTLEIKGNDKFLEQILLDIESAQFRVLALKSRLGKVFCENDADLYTPGLFIPSDPNYRTSLSPRCSPVNHDEIAALEVASTSAYAPEFENEDLVLSGSAVSSYGDAAAHQDIIESTVDMLSSAIGNSSCQNQIDGLGADAVEDILIQNQAAEEDLHNFENVSHPFVIPLGSVKEVEDTSAAAQEISSSETETDPEVAPAVGRKPTLKRCGGAAEFHLRRSKRKRKMRKTSPGNWNGEKKRKEPRKRGQH